MIKFLTWYGLILPGIKFLIQTTQSSSTNVPDTLTLHITRRMGFSIDGIKYIIIFSYKGIGKSSIRVAICCARAANENFRKAPGKSQSDDRKHETSLGKATGFRFLSVSQPLRSATREFSRNVNLFTLATVLQSASLCASIVHCNYFCVMPLKLKVGSINAKTSRRCRRLVSTSM